MPSEKIKKLKKLKNFSKKQEDKGRSRMMEDLVRQEHAILGEISDYFIKKYLEHEKTMITLDDIKIKINSCAGLKENLRFKSIIAVIESYENGSSQKELYDILLEILENKSSQ